jgi:hypothetical protein
MEIALTATTADVFRAASFSQTTTCTDGGSVDWSHRLSEQHESAYNAFVVVVPGGKNVPVTNHQPCFALSEYTGQWLHSQTRLAGSKRKALLSNYRQQSVPAVVLKYDPATRRHQVRYHFEQPSASTTTAAKEVTMSTCTRRATCV